MLRFDRAYSPQQEVREKCIEATGLLVSPESMGRSSGGWN